MRKLLRKKQPTVAEYFQSESQRKKTSRLSFVYGSKRLVAVITILVLASGIAGVAILQKQKSSSAAVERIGVSFNKADSLVPVGAWYLSNTSNNASLTIQSKDNDDLKLGFHAGGSGRFEYGNGYQVCWNIKPGSSPQYPGLKYNSLSLSYSTNEAGTNGMAVYVNGQQAGLSYDSAPGQHQGGAVFNKTITAQLGAIDPGNVISICNVKVGGSTAYFGTERTISVHAYTFGASFDQEQNIDIIGTVTDSAGKGIAGVKISNCQIYPAATTDNNGQFKFQVRKGSGFCVRTQEGLSTDKYSGVKATNANHSPLSSDGASYEGQARTSRGTEYDFKATLKTTTPPPAASTTPQTPAQPAPVGSVIDQNRFSAWGFPLPANPAANHTIEHGNNGKLTINYDKYSYTNGLTGCWSTTIAPGNTATSLSATIASNDAGRNIILFRATGNADKQLDRATNGKVVWNMPTPVGSGGTISICSKVNNPDNKAFEEKKTLTVSSYTIYGTGSKVTDTTPPSVSITSPANGSTQKGTIKVTATASDPSGIQYVEIKNSSNVLKQIAAAPYEYSLDTTKLPDGDYTIAALARDNAGNFKTSSDVTIKINNKTAPAPAGGGTSPTPAPVSTANPNCKAGTTVGMTVPVAATEGTVTGNATKTNGAVQLKDAGDYIECYIKLPSDAQPGGYVLSVSGRAGLSPGQAFNTNYNGSTIQYYMTGGNGGTQKSIGTYDDLGSVNSVKRSPIIRAGAGDTVRTLQPGELVLARITLQKPSTKNGQFFVENLQLFKDPCSDASGSIIADGSVVNGVTCNSPPSTSAPTTGNTGVTTSPASPSTCEAGNFAEAENGVRKPDGANNTASTSDHMFPSVRAAVLLSDKSYVECTLTAPKTGDYAFGAKIRSQDYKKIVAQASLKMTKVEGKTTAERTVSASKGESYSLVRFNEKADYIHLNEGQKAIVRVTFLNDGRDADGDRNLYVDNLQLVEIPPPSSNTNTGSRNDGGEASGSASCIKETTSTEAEDGVLSPNNAQVQPDKNRSGKSIVRISGNNGFVQCTLKVPLKGDYVVGAIVKSENTIGAGRAKAVLSTIGGSKTLTDERDASGDWDSIRQRANSDIRRSLNAGDTVVVRIGVANGSNNVVSKRHLLVDRIELIKIPDQENPNAGTNQPATPGSEVTTIPITDGEQDAEVTQYDTATGTLIKFVQAEKARYQGSVFSDPLAADQKAVRLFANKNFVEYHFYFPESDTYSLDFAARSEDYKNVTANARIVLDKDKVFGNDIKLQKSKDYKYYTSEKRVSIKKGSHTFRVEFTNNKEGGGEDRNLLIDYLRIRGSKKLIDTAPPGANTPSPVAPTFVPLAPNTTVIEAERAPSCLVKKAAYPCDRLAIGDNAAYGGQGLVLNNKNDSVEAEFTVPVTGTYAVSVLMRSMDYAGSGSAKADIYGQNTKIKDDYVPNSNSYSSYAYATKKLSGGSKYRVKVVSTYDKYGGPNADVNLLVDQFRLRLVNPATPDPAQATQSNGQPDWAQSTKNNVLATEWACTPPPVSEYGSFYCPAATKQHVGVMLISYPTNGGRTGQAMVYIPEKMIKQKQSGVAITPLPLVFYLHGRGTARLTADMTAVAPDGPNVPGYMREGFWKNNETKGKLQAAYNTANDATYGGVIIVAPTGQGRVIDGRDWGYVPSIKDFSMLPKYIEESLSYVKVDENRIYTMGSSMGGHNSLQLALLYPKLISAAYSNDGVSDWAERYRQAVAKNDLDLMATIPYETGGLPSDVPREYQLRSPLNNLNPTSAKVPIQIDVDMQDSLVEPSQSIIFYEKMKQLNPNAPDIIKNPNTGHSTGLQPEGRSRTPGSPKIYLRAMNFFYNNGNWL